MKQSQENETVIKELFQMHFLIDEEFEYKSYYEAFEKIRLEKVLSFNIFMIFIS